MRVLLALCVSLFAASASAQGPSLEGALLPRELDALSAWVAAHEHAKCSEHCFVLQRLTLSGSVEHGISFELEGSVLASGSSGSSGSSGEAIAVPLFGPPSEVRLDKVTEDGKQAAIGFEGDHYFVYTASKHFVVRGTLTLQHDRALVITGPLDTLEANLAQGGVVEGARLSGLSGTTIHFENGDQGKSESEEPAIFQLSRAIRVQRETTFEWRLVMRAGTDLGVVRLPLSNGEKVVDVSGAPGWRVEGAELVIPTAGHSASIVIAGTLEKLGTFAIDPRSTYEWWQIEGDPEHRITVSGEAKQLDGADAPFPRTAASRLYLVAKGQSLGLSVETLSSIEALAAVVHANDRVVVVTDRGELVSDESIDYEDNGIDYLRFTPAGRPIFLSTDGASQRILHDLSGDGSLLIALRKGRHVARVQTLSQTTLGLFFGKLVIPSATYALTASQAQIAIGLPRAIHPIVLFGGERAKWFLGLEDAIAIAVALLVAGLTLRTKLARLLAFTSLAVLWAFDHDAFFVVIAAVLAIPLARLAARLTVAGAMNRTRWVLTAASALALIIVAFTLAEHKSSTRERSVAGLDSSVVDEPSGYFRNEDGKSKPKVAMESSAAVAEKDSSGKKEGALAGDGDLVGKNELDGSFANLVAQATLDGVTPVALPLPRSAQRLDVTRELVTSARPFTPTLIYVTDAMRVVVAIVGLLSGLTLLYLHRGALLAFVDRARRFVAERPTPVGSATSANPTSAPSPTSLTSPFALANSTEVSAPEPVAEALPLAPPVG